MALKPIEILKDTISSVAHRITISSVVSLGSNQYQLNTSNTLYLRTFKKVTIDSIEYEVKDFEINSYVTVEATDGTDQPVTVSYFDIDVPLFVFGNPKMVSAEILKRIKNGSIVWPYIWLVEISNTAGTLAPSSSIKSTPSFNIFFLDSNDYENWSIQEHYDNDVYVMSNYIDFVLAAIYSRRDIYDAEAITYTTTNHVNFGDYIVDEGMNERIINDNVTGVQLQIDLPIINLGCSDITVEPNCPAVVVCVPAENQVNGDAKTDIPNGGSKNFVIQDSGGTPVTVTEVSDSSTAFVGEVNTGSPSLNLSTSIKTGQTTSFNTGDDGDLQRGRNADWNTLDSINPFGNLDRFTDTLGTQIYANDVVLDWSFYNPIDEKVFAWKRVLQSPLREDQHLASQPYTFASYSDWVVPNIKELLSLYNHSILNDPLNYSPFNYVITTDYNRIWSCTRTVGNACWYIDAAIFTTNYFNVYHTILKREYTLTELGL